MSARGMTSLSPTGALQIGGAELEYRFIGPTPDAAPTLVLLHEGLGCTRLWGDFPDRLQAATGYGVFAYSRAGYGASSPVSLPRPLDYMEREAREVLPAVLAAIGFRRGLLIGHSDGASIAALYAGGVQDHRVRGVVLIAPHFVTEAMGLAAIARTRADYDRGGLKAKLARWHSNVDNAFLGWSAAWLDPDFRHWDISDCLAYIRVPVAILQGAEDQYGSVRQIEIAQTECDCPVDVTIIPGAAHSPHREATDVTLATIAGFVKDVAAIDAPLPLRLAFD